MKLVSVETPEKSVCKMTFSATAEELEAASNAVYERTRASYTIKGFAKGEADRAQIEADRGEHTFWYDAINDLMDRDVPALYEAAMAEHGFKAVDEPATTWSASKRTRLCGHRHHPAAAGAEPDPDHRLPCGVRNPRRHRQRDRCRAGAPPQCCCRAGAP